MRFPKFTIIAFLFRSKVPKARYIWLTESVCVVMTICAADHSALLLFSESLCVNNAERKVPCRNLDWKPL